MRRPAFITFTGADELTDVDEMVALARQYPIEWGVLFSPKLTGADPRYPDGDILSRLWWLAGDKQLYVKAVVSPDLL